MVNRCTELVGNTPMLRLHGIEVMFGLECAIAAKMEFCNIAGSVKDRVASAMLTAAEKSGQIRPGAVIVEPTSGNTGIGLAVACRTRGYRLILTMPETMSRERRQLLRAFGAQLVLTGGAKGMAGAIERAKRLVAEMPGSFMPDQFNNPANPAIHKMTTGPEIWRETAGKVDIFVAGVGTGGTITGVGHYLKSKKPEIEIVAVEPAGSPILSGGKAGRHKIQGIGAGFIPETLDETVYNQVICVEDEQAMETARNVAAAEGILVGISSGAALWAAIQLAKRPENKGKTIATLFPDSGERYLSTEMFSE